MKGDKLTPRQIAFVDEYLVDLNATQALIRAGYSPKAANVCASQLLAKPNIAAAVAVKQAERARRVEISGDAVLRELAKLGFANMLDYVTIAGDGTASMDLSSITREQGAAIVELTTEDSYDRDGNLTRRNKIKLADKRAALVDMGRHLGLFREGGGNIAMVINIMADDAAL